MKLVIKSGLHLGIILAVVFLLIDCIRWSSGAPDTRKVIVSVIASIIAGLIAGIATVWMLPKILPKQMRRSPRNSR